MYSQHDEERVILEHCPAMGRALDIGAWSATTFSNTRALIERGWEAVLVEPNPPAFAGLIEAYRNNDKIELMNMLAGEQWDVRVFYSSPDALSTADPGNYEKWKALGQFRRILIPEVPLDDILIRAKPPLYFVSIDAEGTSVKLLIKIPLDAIGCKLICVEYDQQRDVAAEYLAQRSFGIIYDDGTNLIAKRRE